MFARIFKPKTTLSNEEVAHGLRWLTWEGTVSMGFFSITTSGFLAAYARATYAAPARAQTFNLFHVVRPLPG